MGLTLLFISIILKLGSNKLQLHIYINLKKVIAEY